MLGGARPSCCEGQDEVSLLLWKSDAAVASDTSAQHKYSLIQNNVVSRYKSATFRSHWRGMFLCHTLLVDKASQEYTKTEK